MNGQTFWYATVKAHEARDKLSAARVAVQTLRDMDCTPTGSAALKALLAELEGQTEALERYVISLKGGP